MEVPFPFIPLRVTIPCESEKGGEGRGGGARLETGQREPQNLQKKIEEDCMHVPFFNGPVSPC